MTKKSEVSGSHGGVENNDLVLKFIESLLSQITVLNEEQKVSEGYDNGD